MRNFVGKNSWEFLRNFSKLSLKTVIPQKSLILGTNSGEFLENFRGISYRKGFSRNSSEILKKKHHGWRIWGNSSLLLKKINLKTYPAKLMILNVYFALKLSNFRSLKRFICLKWILKNFSAILLSQFIHHILPVTPFKTGYKTFLQCIIIAE